MPSITYDCRLCVQKSVRLDKPELLARVFACAPTKRYYWGRCVPCRLGHTVVVSVPELFVCSVPVGCVLCEPVRSSMPL